MSRTLGALGVAVALLAAPAAVGPAAAVPAAPSPRPAVAQRYLVSTSSTAATHRLAELVGQAGGRVTHRYRDVLVGFSASLTPDQVRRLRADARVRSVVPDAVLHATDVQSDPTWGLDRIDQRSATRDHSYTYDSDGSGVNVFVVDTGVRLSHHQLAGRARSGYDFVGDDPTATDCAGHGTHVAGTVAGSTYGVAKKAKIVSVRVLGCSGSGWTSDIVAGLDWVVSHKPSGPSVVNMSLGGDPDAAIDHAVRRTIAAGIPVVVAAGNDGTDACRSSPARVPAALTVAATDSRDVRAGWSNRGSCVDLFAPGVGVRSASNASDTATEVLSGTSMAAPHVTGAVARYLDTHRDATPGQVTTALKAASTTGKVQHAAGSPDRLLYVAP